MKCQPTAGALQMQVTSRTATRTKKERPRDILKGQCKSQIKGLPTKMLLKQMNQLLPFLMSSLAMSLAHESRANHQAKPALPMHGHQVCVLVI